MAEKEMSDQEYVESIVKPLVDHPKDVVTSRSLDERGVLIQLTVNQEDMGKVIGREGRTAKSIRSLLRVFGAKTDSRINLKIVEPDGAEAYVPSESHDDKPRDERPKEERPKPAKKPETTWDMDAIPEVKKSDPDEQVTSVI